MKKTEIFLIIMVCFLGVTAVHSAQIQEELKNGVIRMHIIANSNSTEDQLIKLSVRDEILKQGNLDINKIQNTANAYLASKNIPYGAEASYKMCYVPEKHYKNIAMPEGKYYCLNVVLGNGEGENWWCIAYPPLCFTESVFGDLSKDAKKILMERISKEGIDTIIEKDGVNLKFKTVEEFQKLIRLLDN